MMQNSNAENTVLQQFFHELWADTARIGNPFPYRNSRLHKQGNCRKLLHQRENGQDSLSKYYE